MGGFLPPAERRSGVLLGLYATLALFLLLVGEHIPQAALRGIGAWVFAPFDRVVLVVDRAGAAWRENERLHERITRLELETAHLRAAGVENQRLRESLGLPAYRSLALRPVEVLALSGEPIPTAATLSAGAAPGRARSGDAVVTSDGLVGRVTEVYPGLSRVGAAHRSQRRRWPARSRAPACRACCASSPRRSPGCCSPACRWRTRCGSGSGC